MALCCGPGSRDIFPPGGSPRVGPTQARPSLTAQQAIFVMRGKREKAGWEPKPRELLAGGERSPRELQVGGKRKKENMLGNMRLAKLSL